MPRKTKVGVVVSNKMDKSVVVRVEFRRRHPLYKKVVRRFSKFMAHDENNECQIGDLVRIVETRPLSKRKRWIVEEILEKAVHPEVKVEPLEQEAKVEEEEVAEVLGHVEESEQEKEEGEAAAPAGGDAEASEAESEPEGEEEVSVEVEFEEPQEPAGESAEDDQPSEEKQS